MKKILPKYSSDEMIVRMIFDKDFSTMKPKLVNTIVKYIPMLINKYHQKQKFNQGYIDNFIKLSDGEAITYISFIHHKLDLHSILPKSNGYQKSFDFLMFSVFEPTVRTFTFSNTTSSQVASWQKKMYRAFNPEFSKFCFNYIHKVYPDYLKSIQNDRVQSS